MLNLGSGQLTENPTNGAKKLNIAMFSIHSCPMGELGTEDTGGMNVYVRELARELGDRGHRVDVFTRFHGDGHPEILEVTDNVRFFHVPAGEDRRIHKLDIYPHLAGFLCKLEKLRQKEPVRYDLIHSHYWLSGRVGAWVRESWGVPHIIMFHTLGMIKNSVGVGEKEPELRMITEKHLVDSCDRIIASTERGRQELLQFYDAQPEVIGVVPCGVDLRLFRPMNKADARRQLGMNQKETILLYVGRFTALKGIDRLLAAMPHFRDYSRLKLVIVGGDGAETPESVRLKKLTAALGIEDVVTFIGRIDHENLTPYYNAADLLIVPSFHESFGLVALESLACGTPVIATNVGAMEMIIREGKTGRIIHDAGVPMLVDNIKAELSNANRKTVSAREIHNTVLKFGWSNVAGAMIAEYRTVMDNHCPSDTETASSLRYRLPATSKV